MLIRFRCIKAFIHAFSGRFSRTCLEGISFNFFVCFIFNVSIGSAPKRKNIDIQRNTRVGLGCQFTSNLLSCHHIFSSSTSISSKYKGSMKYDNKIVRQQEEWRYSVKISWPQVQAIKHTSYLSFFYTGQIFWAKILHPKARKLRQIGFRDKMHKSWFIGTNTNCRSRSVGGHNNVFDILKNTRCQITNRV